MAKDSNNGSGGVGIITVLFLIFLILKLTKTIDWSWWWVFSPYLILAGVIGFIFMLAGIGYAASRRNNEN